MVKKVNDGAALVAELNGRCKMTHEDIARYIGVSKYLVTLWKQGKVFPNQQNYEKLVDMNTRLDKNVQYFPKMALYKLCVEDTERIGKEC